MTITEQTIGLMTFIVSVYFGYFLIIIGLVGNIINILVFTQLKRFRRNQSAFYLTVAAIAGCFQLIFTVSTRVTATAFGYDPTRTSLIWCKLRIYIAQFGGVISMIILCLTAIDQYLSTSSDIRLRQISTFKRIRRLVATLIISAALYSIPVAIFHDIRSKAGCIIYNPTYSYYYSFVHLCIVVAILPIIVSSLFSILAYRNVRRIIRRQIPIVRRRLDRQLTAMILVRVALFVITAIPYAAVRTYQLNRPVNQNDTYAVAVNRLLQNIVTTLYNLNHSVFDFLFFFFLLIILFVYIG
jgi:hypothetical protein